MRKRSTAVLSAVLAALILLLAAGCGVNPRLKARKVGYPEQITEKDVITVISATIEDGHAAVKVKLDLSTVALKDFEKIAINKNVANAPYIPCSTEATKRQNSDSVFDAPYKGEVTLYFEDSSISAEDDLFEYWLVFTLVYPNGIGYTHRFVLGEP